MEKMQKGSTPVVPTAGVQSGLASVEKFDPMASAPAEQSGTDRPKADGPSNRRVAQR
jgi:hypothetical protein